MTTPGGTEYIVAGTAACDLSSGVGSGTLVARILSGYAALHSPERDIYIAEAVHLDQETGMPIWRQDGPSERMALVGGGMLVKWDDIEILGFAATHELLSE